MSTYTAPMRGYAAVAQDRHGNDLWFHPHHGFVVRLSTFGVDNTREGIVRAVEYYHDRQRETRPYSVVKVKRNNARARWRPDNT